MRRSFQQCEEYLSTRPPNREENPELATIRTMVWTRARHTRGSCAGNWA
ncbi:hypothetical protein J7L60_03625 [Candidatus Bathyarchaeota archaeon]|nr:hypothetical protein [Candidatus Bathyarchaeota archaeon]